MDGIDEQVSALYAEGEKDFRFKEQCELDRDENTREAKRAAQDIDERGTEMDRLEKEIAERNREIAAMEAHKKDLRQQLAESSDQRMKEQLEYKAAKADDESAIGLLERSMDALKDFYSESGVVLLTKSTARQPDVQAGAAPPPPPSTWSAPVEKAEGEANGIQAILQMLKDDVEKDIRLATAQEKRSTEEYNLFVKETKAMIKRLDREQASQEEKVSVAEELHTAAEANRLNLRSQLQGTMEFLRSIAASCDEMMADFLIRKRDREEEVNGLYEAKAMLMKAETTSEEAKETQAEMPNGPAAAMMGDTTAAGGPAAAGDGEGVFIDVTRTHAPAPAPLLRSQ